MSMILDIEVMDYGLKLFFKGDVNYLTEEVIDREFRPLVEKLKKYRSLPWGFLMDLRQLTDISEDGWHVFRYAYLMALRYGMQRGALLYSDSFPFLDEDIAKSIFPDTKGQLCFLFCESCFSLIGPLTICDQKAVTWIISGTEP